MMTEMGNTLLLDPACGLLVTFPIQTTRFPTRSLHETASLCTCLKHTPETQFCNANGRTEGPSLLFIIILLSLKLWHWKFKSRLKLGRQKNPCPQQEWTGKSQTTENAKARDEPEVAGACAYLHRCALERGMAATDQQKSWKESSLGARATSGSIICTPWPQGNLYMLDLNNLWNSLFLQEAQRETSLFWLKIQNYL